MQENSAQHLDAGEMAKLLEIFRDRAGEGMKEGLEVSSLHPHLAVCSACRDKLEELVSLERQLKGMLVSLHKQGQDGCPDVSVWSAVALGLAGPEETMVYVEHASRCNRCGARLRQAIQQSAELRGELTEAEQEQIAALQSSRPDWQNKLAKQVTRTLDAPREQKSSPSQRSLPAPQMALAGAFVLALLAAAGVVGYRFELRAHQPAEAERMLARAYSQKRTMEVRIAGGNAEYAPIRITRGPAESFAELPKDLLNAELLITSQLKAHPESAGWLQAQAEADMLEGSYQPAVEALRKGLQLEPHSAAILTDLGSAYFQLADGNEKERSEDLRSAYEYLSQALTVKPDDPVALFNRAIVAENQFLYRQALEDSRHYLEVDPASPWAEDARERVKVLQEKVDKPSQVPSPQ